MENYEIESNMNQPKHYLKKFSKTILVFWANIFIDKYH